MAATDEDRVAGVFRDRKIFLTGGSGFMGKIFIEKLLRNTEIGKIYMLIRHKKGKQPKDRLKEIFDDLLFESLKKSMNIEEIYNKIHVIVGDCEKLNLDLSDEDRKLITENVSIIYHFAATIRFDEKLKKAVLMNTRGAREILKIAADCEKLELFAHMSTAYCHLHVPYLLEKPYDPPTDPHEIIKTIENLSDDEIERKSAELLKKFKLPNTYAFTKALAEALVVEAREKHKLRVMIFRPSIIISTWKHPLPGYIDNYNGPVGMMIAAGKGVARSAYIDQKSYGDFLPCDIAINGVFVCTFNFFNYYNPDHFIIHFTSSQEIKLTWEEISDLGVNVVEKKYPLNQIFWYPNMTMTRHRWLHRIRVVLFQWIPAYVVDFFLKCFGYETFMKRAMERIEKGMDVLEYYANNQWDFDNRIQAMFRERLNALEEERYKVNSKNINPLQIFVESALGCRRYVLKTPDSMLKAALSEMRRMYVIDKVLKVLIYSGIGYWIYRSITLLLSGGNIFLNAIQIAFCLFCLIL